MLEEWNEMLQNTSMIPSRIEVDNTVGEQISHGPDEIGSMSASASTRQVTGTRSARSKYKYSGLPTPAYLSDRNQA
jgi:hypothetical protein